MLEILVAGRTERRLAEIVQLGANYFSFARTQILYLSVPFQVSHCTIPRSQRHAQTIAQKHQIQAWVRRHARANLIVYRNSDDARQVVGGRIFYKKSEAAVRIVRDMEPLSQWLPRVSNYPQ